MPWNQPLDYLVPVFVSIRNPFLPKTSKMFFEFTLRHLSEVPWNQPLDYLVPVFVSIRNPFLPKTSKMFFEFTLRHLSEYSEHSQTSRMEHFVRKVSNWKLLNIFRKRSILDVWLGSEYAFAYNELPNIWLFLIISIRSQIYRKTSEYNNALIQEYTVPLSYFHQSSGQASEKKLLEIFHHPEIEFHYLNSVILLCLAISLISKKFFNFYYSKSLILIVELEFRSYFKNHYSM